jgi:hypothetical protein
VSSIDLIFYVEQNILNPTADDPAKVVDRFSGNRLALPHTVKRAVSYAQLVNERVGGYAFSFYSFPKGLVAYHINSPLESIKQSPLIEHCS